LIKQSVLNTTPAFCQPPTCFPLPSCESKTFQAEATKVTLPNLTA
jgi:hypothetical protein